MAWLTKSLRFIPALFVIAVMSLSFTPSALAVLIGPGTGTQNTTEPPGVPAWFNIGKISLGAGIYIGNQWALTAHHLDPATNHTITFYPSDTFPNNGVSFNIDKVIRLVNPDSTNTDMDLVHLSTDPGLPMLSLPTSTPAAGTSIILAGFGVNRGAAVQFLVVGSNWTEVPSGGNFNGYKFNANDALNGVVSKRWGTNLTSTFPGNHLTSIVNNSNNNSFTTVITSQFDDPAVAGSGETASEAIGISGDSGGAFFSATSPGTLLGLMLYDDQLSTPNGQPDGTAIYGNGTDAADLSFYFNQIKTISGVPEPSGVMLAGSALGMLALRRQKK
jgi:hypothetical protein